MSKKNIKMLMFGDVVGKPGVALIQKWLPRLKQKYNADFVIVNGENAAKNGKGLTLAIAQDFVAAGADMITTGNHIWGQEETRVSLSKYPLVLRPLNFPTGCPGKGYAFITVDGCEIAIVNMQGQAFMHEKLDCHFKVMESVLSFLKARSKLIIVDFHAETTAEKVNFAYYLDGRISAIVGTHTHVQTADERILPEGTAFITDLGACSALHSSLGFKTDGMLKRSLTQMPVRGEVENKGPFVIHGVVIDFDRESGKAISIERVKVIDSELIVE